MAKKDVIYIDIDDDITLIIDKLANSSGDIVALVLPKKTAALRSSVNMKLLKNSADKAHKRFVLITEEEALLPLAGAAKVYVASGLKSRPYLPKLPAPQESASALAAEVIDDSDPNNEELDLNASVGELEDQLSGAQVTESKVTKTETKKVKKSSKIKVPNFDKFRMRLFLIGLAVILLVVGWFVMFKVMPKASVAIQAETSKVSADVSFTVDTALDNSNVEKKQLPGEVKEIKKTLTERFKATGEKDVGKKASGVITVKNCDSSDSFTLPAGTQFVDDNTGFVFVSKSAASVPGGSFSNGGIDCTPGEADVDVTAKEGGDSKNLGPRGYSVSGVSEDVTGVGGQMSGGTSEIKKLVTATDISQAKQTLIGKTDKSIKSELAAQFDDTFIVIDDSFASSNTDPVSSVAAGQEANEASISAEFTYTLIGMSKPVLEELIKKDLSSQIDTNALTILDSGINDTELTLDKKVSAKKFDMTARTDGFVGPEINTDELAKEITGKRYSEVIEIIKSKPGVKDVKVDLSPFWVASLPGTDKTTITIEVPDKDNE